jgi:hypothetical protein
MHRRRHALLAAPGIGVPHATGQRARIGVRCEAFAEKPRRPCRSGIARPDSDAAPTPIVVTGAQRQALCGGPVTLRALRIERATEFGGAYSAPLYG